MADPVAGSGLYKYVFHDEIIYIGMSKTNISTRIKQHAFEPKFLPYLNDSKVYFAPITKGKNLIKAYETLLIDQYCPLLNDSEKPRKSTRNDFESMIPGLRWILFDEKKHTPKPKEPTTREPEKRTRIDRMVDNAAAVLLYQWIDKNLKKGNYVKNPHSPYRSIAIPIDDYIDWLMDFENVAPFTTQKNKRCFLMCGLSLRKKREWKGMNLPVGGTGKEKSLLYITVDKDQLYEELTEWLSMAIEEKQEYDSFMKRGATL